MVLHERVALPAPPEKLLRDWHHEAKHTLRLEAGDVEVFPLARARARWPDFRHCLQAVDAWAKDLGLNNLLKQSDMALMACRGASPHHDGEQYGACAFCNMFLSEDRGLDLHFVNTGLRIPLVRGTVVIFDTYQIHEVIPRHSARFMASDFPDSEDLLQVFLTWELPIDNPQLAQLLQIQLDPSTRWTTD